MTLEKKLEEERREEIVQVEKMDEVLSKLNEDQVKTLVKYMKHSLASTPEWIIDSCASRHVTGNASKFSSYTHLAIPESIQTADGTTQPVVGIGIVKCIDSVTLSNVLHAPSFPVNLLSISSTKRDRSETWD